MTEQEYVDATNLAKLRTALTVVRDTLTMRTDEESLQKEIRLALAKWIDILEPIVGQSGGKSEPTG